MPLDTYKTWIEWHVIVANPPASIQEVHILPTRATARAAAKFLRGLDLKCEIHRADCTAFVKYTPNKKSRA